MYKYTCSLDAARGLYESFTTFDKIVVCSEELLTNKALKKEVAKFIPREYYNLGVMKVDEMEVIYE